MPTDQTANISETTLNILDEPALLLDAEGRVVFANQAAGRRLGYPAPELCRLRMWQLYDDLAPPAARELLEKIACGNFDCVYVPIRTHDGMRIPAKTRYAATQWNDAPAWLMLPKFYESDAASDEKFHTAFHANPAGMAILMTDGTFVDVNDSALRAFGYTRQEVMSGFNVGALYHDPSQRAALRAELFQQGRIHRRRIDFMDKQRRVRNILLSIEIIHLQGQPLMLALMDDITELEDTRRRLQEAYDQMEERVRQRTAELTETNLRMQFALESANAGIWELNMQTGELNISPAAMAILGYAPGDAGPLLSDWHKLYHPDDLRATYAAMDRHLRGATPVAHDEYRMLDKQGHYKWISTRGKLIERTPDGAPLRMIGINTDITDRKQLEQAQRVQAEKMAQSDKLATLGFLVAGVAHEINNPTQFIMGNMPLLEKAWTDVAGMLERYYRENGDFVIGGLNFSAARTAIPELFAGVRHGAEQIRNVVAELREYINAVPDEIFEAVDMNAVVRAALTLAGARIRKATGNFQVNYAPNLPPVHGQFRRLEQVVINLIQNACDALRSPNDMIHMTLAARDDQRWIILKVSDTGAGMAPEILRHVFDPFFTTKRARGGMGLGLSISHAIALQHHGRLDFRSKLNTGTTAILALPAGPAPRTNETLDGLTPQWEEPDAKH